MLWFECYFFNSNTNEHTWHVIKYIIFTHAIWFNCVHHRAFAFLVLIKTKHQVAIPKDSLVNCEYYYNDFISSQSAIFISQTQSESVCVCVRVQVLISDSHFAYVWCEREGVWICVVIRIWSRRHVSRFPKHAIYSKIYQPLYHIHIFAQPIEYEYNCDIAFTHIT